MAPISERLHDVVDELEGVFMPFGGKMEIDHGGLQLGMAHVFLDSPEVDASFEEVCGIAVTKGVDGDLAFLYAGLPHGAAQGSLDAGFGHGGLASGGPVAVSSLGWEDECGVSVGGPVATEQSQCGVRKGDIAIFGTFAAVDVDQHALALDVGDLQVERLLEPQPAGVDGGEEGVVVRRLHTPEDASDLFHAEHGGEAVLVLRPQDVEDVPVALKDVLVEETDAAVADPHGLGRPTADVLAMEEVVLKLLLGEEVRGLAIELNQHAQGADVGLLRTFGFAVELKGLGHLLVPLAFHDASPFPRKVDSPAKPWGVERYHSGQMERIGPWLRLWIVPLEDYTGAWQEQGHESAAKRLT